MGDGGYTTMVMAMVAGEERREEERREEDKGEETREGKLPTVKLPACIHDMQREAGDPRSCRRVTGDCLSYLRCFY